MNAGLRNDRRLARASSSETPVTISRCEGRDRRRTRLWPNPTFDEEPIFVTPVSAIACNGATPRGTRGGYVTATLDVGMTANVPVIDLHAQSVALYGELGFCPVPGGDVSASTGGPVGDFFCDDHTHFSASGAERIAALVAEALRAQDIGLARYLK